MGDIKLFRTVNQEILDELLVEIDFGQALSVAKYVMNKRDYRVKKLFDTLVESYPEIFEGVKLYFSDGKKINTCFGYHGNDIDKTLIFIACPQLIYFKLFAPSWYKRMKKRLRKINKNLDLYDFMLLHELGHHLDLIDDPDKFSELEDLKYIILDKLEKNYPNISLNKYQAIYSHTELEINANENAFKMAEVLNRNNGA